MGRVGQNREVGSINKLEDKVKAQGGSDVTMVLDVEEVRRQLQEELQLINDEEAVEEEHQDTTSQTSKPDWKVKPNTSTDFVYYHQSNHNQYLVNKSVSNL